MATAKAHDKTPDGEAEASATSPEPANPVVPPADAPDKPIAPAPDGKPQTIVTHVWAAAGPIPKASVLQTAIQSVRDAIPVVFELEAEITGAKKVKQNDQDGTEFEVTITYTPRQVAGGKEEPVDIDKVVKGLDVPRSIDGITGAEGDPDFHNRQPTEL